MAVASSVCRAVGRGSGAACAFPTPAGIRGASSAASAPASTAAAAAQPSTAGVRPYEEIPGPKALPVVGNVWRFLPGIGPWGGMDFLDIHYTLRDTYGDIVRLTGLLNNRDVVAVYDPVNIEKVFKNEGPWPIREAFVSLNYYRRFINKAKYQGSNGLLTTNGKEWQDFRKSVQAPMLQPRAVAKYTQPIDAVASEFMERLREIRDKNGILPKDADNWFFRWALESIATIALDIRLGCLGSDVAGEPQQMIDSVQVLFEGMFELEMKPSVWKYISTPMWRKYVKAIGVFETVSQKYIENAVDRLKSKVSENGDLGDDLSVLERLLLSNENPRIAMTMALDMLFAGIDTTSISTRTLLYYLSRNPDNQEQLYAELRRVLPERDTPVTTEHLQEMKYLRAAIKESMRLRPIAIGSIRENCIDGLVLSNYSIPKGVDLVMMMAITGNDPRFVPHADRFMPERWLKGEDQALRGHPFATLPFGFGRRICVGKRFAELEIEVLNAKLLRNFRVEYPCKEEFQTRLLHGMTSPMTFRLIDRD